MSSINQFLFWAEFLIVVVIGVSVLFCVFPAYWRSHAPSWTSHSRSWWPFSTAWPTTLSRCGRCHTASISLISFCDDSHGWRDLFCWQPA